MQPTVGVIGAQGQMGVWFSALFARCGCRVLAADLGTALSNRDVARQSDIVLVCVPLRHVPSVLHEVVDALPATSLLVDIASLMTPSRPALQRAPAGCALHPLFGPTTGSLSGQTLVLSPLADTTTHTWYNWLVHLLRGQGAVLREMSPEEHDTAMATVQGLLHASFVAFASALPASGTSVADAVLLATPTMRLYLGLIARILNQPADLYADLLTINPASAAALHALHVALGDVEQAVRAADVDRCQSLFEHARTALGVHGAALIPEAEYALATAQHAPQRRDSDGT